MQSILAVAGWRAYMCVRVCTFVVESRSEPVLVMVKLAVTVRSSLSCTVSTVLLKYTLGTVEGGQGRGGEGEGRGGEGRGGEGRGGEGSGGEGRGGEGRGGEGDNCVRLCNSFTRINLLWNFRISSVIILACDIINIPKCYD